MLKQLLRLIGLAPASEIEFWKKTLHKEKAETANMVDSILTFADTEEVRFCLRGHPAFQFYGFFGSPKHKVVKANSTVDQAKSLVDAMSVLRGRAAETEVEMRRLTNALAEAVSEHRKLAMAQEPPRFATGGYPGLRDGEVPVLVTPGCEFHIPEGVSLSDAFRAHLAAKKPNEIGHVDDVTGRACITVRDYYESDVLVDRPFYRYRDDPMADDPWVLYDSVDQHTANKNVYDIWRQNAAHPRTVDGDYPVYIEKADYARMVWAPEGEA